jgi:hypothetical protein
MRQQKSLQHMLCTSVSKDTAHVGCGNHFKRCCLLQHGEEGVYVVLSSCLLCAMQGTVEEMAMDKALRSVKRTICCIYGYKVSDA